MYHKKQVNFKTYVLINFTKAIKCAHNVHVMFEQLTFVSHIITNIKCTIYFGYTIVSLNYSRKLISLTFL